MKATSLFREAMSEQKISASLSIVLVVGVEVSKDAGVFVMAHLCNRYRVRARNARNNAMHTPLSKLLSLNTQQLH